MPEDRAHHPEAVNPLPPVYQGQLGREKLTELFTDLRATANVLHVQVRPVGSSSADERTSLQRAQKMIEADLARSVQVRYRYQGDTWCDTLLAGRDGIRLVRIQQEIDPDTSEDA